jgi:hypothetical protein
MQPPYPQAPIPGPPLKKKSDKGCLIALAVTGGVVALFVAIGGFGVYHFSQTKEGKAIFGAVGDFTRLIQESQNAPGTKEVRALGCTTAMAMDIDKWGSVFQAFDASVPAGEFSMMVVCQTSHNPAPTCDDVARTYLSAAGPPARDLAVQVTRGGGNSGSLCSTLYKPDGTRLRDLAPGSTPTVPTSR